ncbi:aminotransferase class I/II-fold pyridoxal phosphate-dependent enzyme [Lelliottia jeotgali]
MVPQAGMYVWCQLPQGKDAATLARACLKEGVVLAPGNAFSQSMTAGDFLRFNVAQSGDSKIYEVLKRALNA